MDVSQSDREWCIEADLPGVKEDDIHVEVRDNHLLLRAEMRQDEQPQGAQARGGQQEQQQGQQPERPQRQYFQRERRYGYFQRLLPLPENVDEENISCDFSNGVQTIHLPKLEQARQQARRIPVGRGQAAPEISAPRGNGRSESREPAISGMKRGETGTEAAGETQTGAAEQETRKTRKR
jgi:HSP20 family protein